ncbi:MAG TPA: helix-turn-helix domain-containing protein [Thermoanaerobaculia bacterium]|nr:helix-turn-helix domain-containing protein [Thermoanaerobaculia bacterium]
MNLSLSEAATALGKSERQVRYLIAQGHLPATKQGGRWQVDSSELPLSEGRRQALEGQLGAARTAVERALAPLAKAVGAPAERRSFSVRDLEAFCATPA